MAHGHQSDETHETITGQRETPRAAGTASWRVQRDLLVTTILQGEHPRYIVSVRETGRIFTLTAAQFAILQQLDTHRTPEESGGSSIPEVFVQKLATLSLITPHLSSPVRSSLEPPTERNAPYNGEPLRGNLDMDSVTLARWALERAVREERWPLVNWPVPADLSAQGAAFVCLKRDGRLRGCFGSVVPQRERLADDIAQAAMGAACWDDRFTPVRPEELSDLDITIDLIDERFTAEQPGKWDPAVFGVQLLSDERILATLLPNLEGITRVERQLEIAWRKARTAIRARASHEADDIECAGVRIERFTTRRFPCSTPAPLRPYAPALAMAWTLTEGENSQVADTHADGGGYGDLG